MTKKTIQDAAEEVEVQEPRKLNMEEKRKLEKLLIADIDSALQRYDRVTIEERQALIERLKRTPIAEAKSLYERYKLAQKQKVDAEKKLDELGYEIQYDGALTLNTRGNVVQQLTEFDNRAEEKQHQLATLKRGYVIKLFADHADTKSLFDSLAADLKRLVG